MSRNSFRESLVGGRNFPPGSYYHHHRLGHSLSGFSRDTTDENLDLFSKNRRNSLASSDESSNVLAKLGRLSVGSGKLAKSGVDDLLTSTDIGKHDYDWLLTPPETPLFPSSEGKESQPPSVASRSRSLARSLSTKASRLSVSQSESHPSTRPTRSSSVTRSSISSSQFSPYSSNRSSSILNTSSASVSSYTRPSSPITRSPSAARPSTPSTRPTSRPSTPSRVRPAPTSSLIDKTLPSQSSRPSTPSSRAQILANLNSTASRSNSRSSTPTRRNSAPSVSLASGPSTPAGRGLSNGRTPAPASRPSSPGPRLRSPQQPVVPPDFLLDTPPNLRTTLPDRPLSAGRSRPGAVVTTKGNPETTGLTNVPRGHSSPIISRGRLSEAPGKGRVHSNGHVADMSGPRKPAQASDLGMRRSVKSSSTVTESTGFGRTISKKSLDMAIRHMDLRNGTGTGSTRVISGTTLFPQSIRSASKAQPVRCMSAPESTNNGDILENGDHISSPAEIGNADVEGRYSAKLREVDIYESSRYDAILLKEDLENTNWLHSIDDKSDQGSIFENGFESLPEPFGPL